MNPDFQRRIQRYGWDRAAEYYESGWRKQLWPAQKRLLAMADAIPGEDVIDISCGTGLLTFPLAEKVLPDGKVTGTDLSDGMVNKASEVAGTRGITDVLFYRMDAEDLQFSDNSFDLAVNSLGLMYVPYPDRAVREMYRVLKPGGRAAALVWGRRRECGWAEIFPIVDRRVSSDVCPLFYQLGTGDSLQRTLEKAGFRDIDVIRFKEYLHFDSEKDALMGAFLGGPVALAYKRFSETVRQEVHDEYLKSIKIYKMNGGFEIPGEFVAVSAMRPV